MANPENLRTPSSSEARKIGKKGGIASGKKRREKRDILSWLKVLLDEDVSTDAGEMQRAAAIALSLLNRGEQGDVQAIKTLLEYLYGTKASVDLTSSDGSMATPKEVTLRIVRPEAKE